MEHVLVAIVLLHLIALLIWEKRFVKVMAWIYWAILVLALGSAGLGGLAAILFGFGLVVFCAWIERREWERDLNSNNGSKIRGNRNEDAMV